MPMCSGSGVWLFKRSCMIAEVPPGQTVVCITFATGLDNVLL